MWSTQKTGAWGTFGVGRMSLYTCMMTLNGWYDGFARLNSSAILRLISSSCSRFRRILVWSAEPWYS
jgi:hypothetical protein